jgi:hypothetical protein
LRLPADRAGIFSRISGSFGHCRVLSRNRRVGGEWRPTSQWPPLHPGASAGCRSLLHVGRVGAPGLFVSVKTLWLCGSHVPSLGAGGACRYERRQAPAHSQLGPRRGGYAKLQCVLWRRRSRDDVIATTGTVPPPTLDSPKLSRQVVTGRMPRVLHGGLLQVHPILGRSFSRPIFCVSWGASQSPYPSANIKRLGVRARPRRAGVWPHFRPRRRIRAEKFGRPWRAEPASISHFLDIP